MSYGHGCELILHLWRGVLSPVNLASPSPISFPLCNCEFANIPFKRFCGWTISFDSAAAPPAGRVPSLMRLSLREIENVDVGPLGVLEQNPTLKWALTPNRPTHCHILTCLGFGMCGLFCCKIFIKISFLVCPWAVIWYLKPWVSEVMLLSLFQAILQNFIQGIVDLKKTHDVKWPWSRVNFSKYFTFHLCRPVEWPLMYTVASTFVLRPGLRLKTELRLQKLLWPSGLPLQNEPFHCEFLHSACPSCW